MLDAAQDIWTLSTLPGNRLERLTRDRKGQYGIRVNDQWRVCFERRDGHTVRLLHARRERVSSRHSFQGTCTPRDLGRLQRAQHRVP